MPWFKVDDKLHSHRKARKAGPAAMGLWVLAGSWSADQLSNGFVPDYIAAAMDRDYRKHANSLVAAGLWEEDGENGDKGWRFHDWDDMQPTRADVEEKRESARERMRRVRAQGGKRSEDVRANNERSSEPVRSTPTRPDPTRTKEEDTDFVGWYDTYPKKVAKPAAAKAYKAARKKTSAETLLAGARNMAKMYATDKTFCPNPATWLNQERWSDEDVPAARTNGHAPPPAYEEPPMRTPTW